MRESQKEKEKIIKKKDKKEKYKEKEKGICRRSRPQIVVAGAHNIPDSQGSLFAAGSRHSCQWPKSTGICESEALTKPGRDGHTAENYTEKLVNSTQTYYLIIYDPSDLRSQGTITASSRKWKVL